MKIKQLLNKKSIIASLALSAFVFTNAHAQFPTAPTTTQKKGFMLEKGTGYMCGSCPTIEANNYAEIDKYPKGQGMMILYHIGSADTRPQSGQLNKDYTTRFGDSIYPIQGSYLWPFYLNMQINRRYKGTLASSSVFTYGSGGQEIPNECANLAAENAPINIAVNSTYNPTTKEITAYVQLYYVSTTTTPRYVQVILTEDSVIGPQTGVPGQSGFKYDYVHMDMFRGNMSKAFGEQGIEVPAKTAGQTANLTFKYTIPAKYGEWIKYGSSYGTAQTTANYKHFQLTAYVCEPKNSSGAQALFGKILNVKRAHLGTSSAPIGIEESAATTGVSLYPNPSNGIFYLNTNTVDNFTYTVYDISGKQVNSGDVNPNEPTAIDLSNYEKGVYFIRVNSEKSGSSIHKVMLSE